MRLFVGLRVSPEARGALAREAARWAREDPAWKPTREADLHLTLQFLGSTAEQQVPAIEAALARVARAHEPIDVRYAGVGVFPERGPPSVLWAGLSETRSGALATLAAAVGEVLGPLGFAPEDRPWHAHVTLARVGRGVAASAGTRTWVEEAREADFGRDRLSVLRLIVSSAGPGVYAYNDLTSHPLGASL